MNTNNDTITVGIIEAVETAIDCGLCGTQIADLRRITQIYATVHGKTVADLVDTPPAEIVKWTKEFVDMIRTESATAEPAVTIKPITIPILIAIEDALGTPLFGGGVDLDRIKNQLICVSAICPDCDVSAIRNMPYPDYRCKVWKPVRTAILQALGIVTGDDTKNP